MPEDHENNTEEPTDKRLQEAHDRGQFARAPEIGVVAGLITATMVIMIMGKTQALHIAQFSIALFGHLETIDVKMEGIEDWARLGGMMMLGLCTPMLGACALAGVMAGGLQTSFRLTPDVLEPKLDKLNPLSGFQRIFSKDGAVRLLTDSIKFSIVGFLVYGAVQQIMSDPIFYTPVPVHRLGTFIYECTIMLLFRLSLALGTLAGANYLYQRYKIHKELMMSRHEVKEEMKEANGDPAVKAAQRQMARRLLQKQMLASVPTADVVVTNPTHYAVALKYERGKDQAPVVLAKGDAMFAKRIKALALQHEVPMVENKPVARALFKYGQVGSAIPTQLYQAVAEILGYVYRTHRYYFHQLKARRMALS